MGGTARVDRRNEVSIVSPKFLGFNVAIFLTFAFGYMLLVVLLMLLGQMGGSGTTATTATSTSEFGGAFFGSSITVAVFGLTVALAPFIALVTGLFTGIGTRATITAAVTGLVGGILGFMTVALLMLGVAIVLMGGGTGGIVMLAVILGGIAIVTGITGSASAAISNHYQ